MAEKQDKPKSARKADRLHHELLVAYPTEDGFITAPATNISKGGLFINTQNLLAVGTTLKLILSLPDSASPLNLTGKVSRVNEVDSATSSGPGMAIEFLDVDDEKKARIERFVERLRKELPDELLQAPGGSKK